MDKKTRECFNTEIYQAASPFSGKQAEALEVLSDQLSDDRDRRMRYIFGVLIWSLLMTYIITIACSCVHVAQVPAQLRPVGQVQLDTVVRINYFCVDKDPYIDGTTNFGGGIGTGVILNSRFVLTAAHVVGVSTGDASWKRCGFTDDVHVITTTGRRLRMVVVTRDDDADLALLEIMSADSFGNIAPPVIGPRPLVDTAVCHASASPKLGVDCGDVLTHFDTTIRNDTLMSAPVHHGNSGGPVYDELGRLVGITTALFPPNGDFGGYYTSLAGHERMLKP